MRAVVADPPAAEYTTGAFGDVSPLACEETGLARVGYHCNGVEGNGVAGVVNRDHAMQVFEVFFFDCHRKRRGVERDRHTLVIGGQRSSVALDDLMECDQDAVEVRFGPRLPLE